MQDPLPAAETCRHLFVALLPACPAERLTLGGSAIGGIRETQEMLGEAALLLLPALRAFCYLPAEFAASNSCEVGSLRDGEGYCIILAGCTSCCLPTALAFTCQ